MEPFNTTGVTLATHNSRFLSVVHTIISQNANNPLYYNANSLTPTLCVPFFRCCWKAVSKIRTLLYVIPTVLRGMVTDVHAALLKLVLGLRMANGQVASLRTCQRMRIPHTSFLRKSSVPQIKVCISHTTWSSSRHSSLLNNRIPLHKTKESLVEGLVDLEGSVPKSSIVPSLKPVVHYAKQVSMVGLDFFICYICHLHI